MASIQRFLLVSFIICSGVFIANASPTLRASAFQSAARRSLHYAQVETLLYPRSLQLRRPSTDVEGTPSSPNSESSQYDPDEDFDSLGKNYDPLEKNYDPEDYGVRKSDGIRYVRVVDPQGNRNDEKMVEFKAHELARHKAYKTMLEAEADVKEAEVNVFEAQRRLNMAKLLYSGASKAAKEKNLEVDPRVAQDVDVAKQDLARVTSESEPDKKAQAFQEAQKNYENAKNKLETWMAEAGWRYKFVDAYFNDEISLEDSIWTKSSKATA